MTKSNWLIFFKIMEMGKYMTEYATLIFDIKKTDAKASVLMYLRFKP